MEGGQKAQKAVGAYASRRQEIKKIHDPASTGLKDQEQSERLVWAMSCCQVRAGQVALLPLYDTACLTDWPLLAEEVFLPVN